MIRRLFWFLLGAISAIFGLNYMKKKAESTAERFSSENIADTLTDLATSVKDYAVGLWQGVVSGESLDEQELANYFDNTETTESNTLRQSSPNNSPNSSPTDNSRN